MTAARYDIELEQGATFRHTLDYSDVDDRPIDLTGATARMMFKGGYTSAAVITLTTENGGIVLGGTAGTIRLLIADTVTQALDIDFGVYDLRLVYPDTTKDRLIEGKFSVSRGVTL